MLSKRHGVSHAQGEHHLLFNAGLLCVVNHDTLGLAVEGDEGILQGEQGPRFCLEVDAVEAGQGYVLP